MLALKDPSNAELEWLSTHPSHQKRAELIKDRMPEVKNYTVYLDIICIVSYSKNTEVLVIVWVHFFSATRNVEIIRMS